MKRLTALLFTVALISTAAFADEVDNPAYKLWSSFKPKAHATFTMQATHGSMTFNMTMKQTLLSIDADKAVVRHEMSMNMGGQQQNMPSQELPIPAKIDSSLVDPMYQKLGDNSTKSGTETLTVGDKDIECTWYEVDGSRNGETMKGKVWLSDNIPGSMVKFDGKSTGPQGNGQIKIQATSFSAGE